MVEPAADITQVTYIRPSVIARGEPIVKKIEELKKDSSNFEKGKNVNKGGDYRRDNFGRGERSRGGAYNNKYGNNR